MHRVKNGKFVTGKDVCLMKIKGLGKKWLLPLRRQ